MEKKKHRIIFLKSQMSNKFMGGKAQPYLQSGKGKFKPQRDANSYSPHKGKLNT